MTSNAAQPQPIKQVGHYALFARVYETRWEDLYHGRDAESGEVVSVKLISTTLPPLEQERLFFNESDALRALKHPNILRLVEADGRPGSFYIAVESLEGDSLRTLIEEKRPVPLKHKLEIIAQAADALHYCHQRGILHRTLMPREIVRKPDGQVKLHGFHLRRDLNDPNKRTTGYFIAKLRYPAPEQVRGEQSDFRADIFSLGAILYELICCAPPFSEPNLAMALVKIVASPPDPLEKYLPNPPKRLVEVVDKALAKNAAERYQTAEEFARDLRSLAKTL